MGLLWYLIKCKLLRRDIGIRIWLNSKTIDKLKKGKVVLPEYKGHFIVLTQEKKLIPEMLFGWGDMDKHDVKRMKHRWGELRE